MFFFNSILISLYLVGGAAILVRSLPEEGSEDGGIKNIDLVTRVS